MEPQINQQFQQTTSLSTDGFNYSGAQMSGSVFADYDYNNFNKAIVDDIQNPDATRQMSLLYDPYESVRAVEVSMSTNNTMLNSRYHPYRKYSPATDGSFTNTAMYCNTGQVASNVDFPSDVPPASLYSYPGNYGQSSQQMVFTNCDGVNNCASYQDTNLQWQTNNNIQFDMNSNNNNINCSSYYGRPSTSFHTNDITHQTENTISGYNRGQYHLSQFNPVTSRYHKATRYSGRHPINAAHARIMDIESASSPEVEFLEDASGQKGSPESKKRGTKKRKKKGVNEPQKPVSAYALFFRDTQATIKADNPSATFGEISKIVASMWDSLSEEAKQVYKQKTETAKRDYLKQLAAYRANLVSRGGLDADDEDSQPLSFIKLKMNDQRSSPNASPRIDLPPPPKLQIAPNITPRSQTSQQIQSSNITSLPADAPGMCVNISGNVEHMSMSNCHNIQQNIPVQHIILRPVPTSNSSNPINPPPIQLRNMVPKAHSPVTFLQSKPGQVIKVLPPNQAANIVSLNGGKNRIMKMTDMMRNVDASATQPPSNVQPILQTLAQENRIKETSLQDSDMPTEDLSKISRANGDTANEVIDLTEGISHQTQPITTVTSIQPSKGYESGSVRICVREGCPNPAVSDPQWNDEYCSSVCAVRHCRDVFDGWVAVRQVSASVI